MTTLRNNIPELDKLFAEQREISAKMMKNYNKQLNAKLQSLYEEAYYDIPDNKEAILSIPNELTGGRTEYRIDGEVARAADIMRYEYIPCINPS